MTVNTDINTVKYVGDSVTVTFPITFYFLENKDLGVYLKRASTGVSTKLVLNSDYTLTGAGVEAGGTLTLVNAPLINDQVLARRELDIVQLTAYPPNDKFPAAAHERALDRGTMVDQELAGELSLTLSLDPFGDFYDAHNHRIINLADGIDPQDVVNVRQLSTAIAGGTGLMAPQKWDFTGDGATKDFPIPGADIADALAYDAALAGAVIEPNVDYTVVVGTDVSQSLLRFTTAPGNGVTGFAVLRGFAALAGNGGPITTTASNIYTTTDGTTFTAADGSTFTVLDNTFQNALIIVTSNTDVTLTIKKNTGATNDWAAGQYFSAMAYGEGAVTFAIQDGVGTLKPSPGFLSTTRGQNSIISASVLYATSDQWGISGDLLRATATPDVQVFTLPCSDELTTDIAVASNVYQFRLPYGFLVTDVRASLNVAQSAGSDLVVDVKAGGTSIFSTLLSFDNTELVTTTATTPYVLTNPTSTALTDGELVSVDVTQVGTAGARGLKVQLIGQRTT